MTSQVRIRHFLAWIKIDRQYAVTDYNRVFAHGAGVPGIFFKYDLEAMSLTIRERTTSLYQFLIRLVGVIGERPRMYANHLADSHRRSMDRCIIRATCLQSCSETNRQEAIEREGIDALLHCLASHQQNRQRVRVFWRRAKREWAGFESRT